VVLVDPTPAAVRGHDLERADVVDGQAVLAAVERQTAAEQVADHPDRRRRAMHRGESVRDDGGDHVAPHRAGLHARHARLGLDLDFAVVEGELQQDGPLE
jgi:hypothetical protein